MPVESKSVQRRNSVRIAVSLLLMFLLVASLPAGRTTASTPRGSPAPTQLNPLNLALLWHMHQPLYKNVLTGLYEMPWARDHAATEYLDHPEILLKHPAVNVTFNLVPSLLMQLEDYAFHNATDNHILLARIPLATATPAERQQMAQEFIRLAPWYYTNVSTNPYYNTYAAFPRLHDLVAKVGVDPLSLNDTELQDLETIYFLRQISVPYIQGDYNISDRNQTILDLYHKGTGYAEADTETILTAQRAIMGKLEGVYKRAQDIGQAEIITTPYYHPISPLLLMGTVPSDDGLHNISKGVWSDDTAYQMQNASAFYAARFGHNASGMWSSEQAVSSDMIPYAADAGFNWTSSDEAVLWHSQVGGQTVGNSLLNRTQVYSVTVSGRTMDFVFRDTNISNSVSFSYGSQATNQAVSNFMATLRGYHDNMSGPQRADRLVTLAADGENWMFQAGYPNDGRDFLNRLYENLTAAQAAGWLRTWKIGDFIEQPGRVIVPLSTLWAGSWIDYNFRTWSGEEEEQVGWARLTAARQRVVAFTQAQEGRSFVAPTSGPAVKRAWEAIFAAEGSDWFWWYGDDQSSGDDGKFDMMFKAHLTTAYLSTGVPPPLDVSAVWGANATPNQPGNVTEKSPTPTVDGTPSPGEWANATGWTKAATGDLLHLKGFYAFADAGSLYLRIDLNGDASALRGTTGKDVEVYISNPVRTAQNDMEVNLNRYGVNFATKNGGYRFDWAAAFRLHFVFSQSLSTGITPWSLFTPHEGTNFLGDGTWTYAAGRDDGANVGSVIEAQVALSNLGLGPGDLIRLVAVTSNGTQDVDILPATGPGQVTVLVPSPGPPIAVFKDPVGDDTGDGDYTYAQSADYRCSDGSHCEKKLYDMTYFNISDSPTSLTFTISFVDIGMNQWNGPNGFSYQIMDIYIDSDRVPGSGNLLMLTGPKANVTPDFAWEAAIQAAGWSDQRTYVTHDSASSQRLQSGLLVHRVPGTMSIDITVPKKLLPAGDPKTWGYVVVSGSQDGFGFDYWRAVAAYAGYWVCGGAGQPAKGIRADFAPRIFDAILMPGTNQSDVLGSYTNSAQAQVPGVVIQMKAPSKPTVQVTPSPPWSKGDSVTVTWNATPNPDTLRPIQSYDVNISYAPTDLVVPELVTSAEQTTFTVSKEQNITIKVTAFDGVATSTAFIGKYEVKRSPPPPPVNHAPVLTNPSVDPSQGDERTVFLFSVRYVDVDDNAPIVSLVMDGAPTAMTYIGGDNSTGATFRVTLTLAVGDHSYVFRANDQQNTANSTVETEAFTLHVASAGGVSVTTLALAGAGVAAAAVACVVVYFLWRRRTPPKESAKAEPPEEAQPEAPMEPKEGE